MSLRSFSPAVLLALSGLAYLMQPAPCRAQATSYNIRTYAGDPAGASGFSGDGLPPANAKFNSPIAVALDASHNLYIADTGNARIRVISNNKVNPFAGNGSIGYSGDGGKAFSASLSSPYYLRVDPSGNVYIADTNNDVVRMVDSNQNISTIAGVNGNYGYFQNQDGGPATKAFLDLPVGLAFDPAGNLYIADSKDDRIRKVSPASSQGTINTVAGSNQWDTYGGDGSPATANGASLFHPLGIAIDGAGNLYIADSSNNRIRMVNTSGIITTVAGTGTAGFSGDSGPATKAQLNRPFDVAVDSSGDLFIADYNNQRIRMVDTSGNIQTIAGTTGSGYTGDGGPATSARLNYPTSIAVDTNGDIYIADSSNNVIRLLTPTGPSISNTVISASGYGCGVPGAPCGFTSIAPGSWIEIYGTNLAVDTRQWAASDFKGTNAPTSLDGTSVTVGGQAAYIGYISGGQVNALVPSTVPTGQQQVVVKNAAGTSTAFTVNVNALEPGLLALPQWNIGGTQYTTALFPGGPPLTYVLPPGAIAGLNCQRAQAGQIIVLYGIGFGPVSPTVSDGQPGPQISTLTLPLQISIGGVQAQVQYYGLAPTFYGLYQFNVVVPQVPASDKVPITFSLNGTPGTQKLYIAVQ